MTAQQLRNSILQLAIQGKLVPQDPADEPATALLERIHAEKEQLVKSGKLKKKDLVSTPIADEDKPFELPKGWEWCRLGELSQMIGDGTHQTPHYVNKGVPFLSVQNISTGKLTTNKIKYISEAEHIEINKRVNPEKGDILICRIGTLGKALEIYWDFNFSIFVSLGLIRLIDNRLSKYIVTAINSPLGHQWIEENKVGGGTHTFKINLGDMPNFIIPLPPLAEQKRIVAKLEELLPIVEEYGKAQSALDELNTELPNKLRQSILQQAIQGKLVPQDPSDEPATVLLERIHAEKELLVKSGKLKKKDLVSTPIADEDKPFELPKGWEWCRLGELSQMIGDGTHQTPHYVNKGVPFLSVQNISTGKLTTNKIKYISEAEHIEINKRVNPEKGDILICRIGTLGKALEIYWDFNFSIFVSLGLIRLIDNRLSKYIVTAINSPLGHQWIEENKVGGGTHTFKINLGDMPNFIIPLPPLAEQKRIVAKIEELFSAIDQLK